MDDDTAMPDRVARPDAASKLRGCDAISGGMLDTTEKRVTAGRNADDSNSNGSVMCVLLLVSFSLTLIFLLVLSLSFLSVTFLAL